MDYQHLEIEISDHVGWLWMNRPAKYNAMSADMWSDIPRAMAALGADPEVRVVVVAGRGPSFTVGIDVGMLGSVARVEGASEAVRKQAFYRHVKELQDTMSSFADCPKPVIAAVHGHCLGAGIDLITACDIRLSTADAVLGIRETRMGLVADVGTFQRLPKIISPGHLAELAYTGKDIDGAEAERIGLVNHTYPDAEALFEAARSLAAEIADNSPLVVQGIKEVLAAEEDMSTSAALDHVAMWNTSFLMSNDLNEAVTAFFEKREPRFTGT